MFKHRIVLALMIIGLAAIVIAPQASASSGAHVSKSKTVKRHKSKAKPTPVSLKPISITVRGEFVPICDTGWPPKCGAPSEMSSVVYCPPGYTVESGGYESFGSLQNVTQTASNPVGGGWAVVFRANETVLTDTPHVSYFRALAQCQTLVPA